MRPSPPGPLSHRPPVLRERGRAAAGSSAAGYNLVMLMVLLTVLNIAIAIALPAWSGVIRRDKEEELIFRGLQYAEAIRVFQHRFGRQPVRLEELLEVKPRSIRQLWKDPMTDDGKWVLIPLQGPQGGLQLQTPNDGEGKGGKDGGDAKDSGDEGDADADESESEDSKGPGGLFPKKDDLQVGPFKGVHSRSGKKSFLVFTGHDRYDEWHFTVDLLINPAPQGQQQPPSVLGGDPSQSAGGGLQLSTRWIGRPVPEFLMPRQGSGLPGGGAGSGRENPPGGGGGKGGKGGPPRSTGKP